MMEFLRVLARICIALGILAVCCAVALILLTSWKIPLHIYQLHVLQKHFRDAVGPIHPAQSKLIVEMSEFGNFGNSNHCDYIVGEFRSSQLQMEEIKRFYDGAKVRSFDGGPPLSVEIYFPEDLREAAAHDYYWNHWLERYIPSQERISYQNTYFVFTESAMHPPDGDIRCH